MRPAYVASSFLLLMLPWYMTLSRGNEIRTLIHHKYTGSTSGVLRRRGAAQRRVADNGSSYECPPQPFWTGVAMAPCLTSFPARWAHSPYRFMQVPRNGDFRLATPKFAHFWVLLHERTLKSSYLMLWRTRIEFSGESCHGKVGAPVPTSKNNARFLLILTLSLL